MSGTDFMYRHPFLICYDIRNPSIRTKIRNIISMYKILPSQNSCYECFMTYEEVNSLVEYCNKIIDVKTDKLALFLLDKRIPIYKNGVKTFINTDFFIVS